MPWDIDGEQEPTRFYFAADKQEWVDLRIVDDDDIQAIRDELGIKPKTVYQPNPAKDNALEMVQEAVNPEKLEAFARRLNSRGIPAWRLIDKNGCEIEHSEENVDLMLRKSRRFANFVKKHLEKLRKDIEAESKEEIKN